MYDFSGLRPTTKEMAVAILISFAVLVGIFCAGYMLGLRNAGSGAPDNGNGINHVGEQLGQAESNQQHITDGISAAAGTGQSIAGTGAAITESAGNIASGVNEAAGLIDSCQQILGRIRNRGKKGTPAN